MNFPSFCSPSFFQLVELSDNTHRLSEWVAFVQSSGINPYAGHWLRTTMSFITNLFPLSQGGKHDGILPVPPPPLHTRSSQNDTFNENPGTPTRNSFITPISTPHGSPSKNRNPPGYNELPSTFEVSAKLTPTTLGSPTKSGRSQTTTPLSPGKGNALAADDSYFAHHSNNVDDSIVHKSAVSPGTPLRKQGKENTPPGSRQGLESVAQNQAAISRQEPYHHREHPQQNTKKYITQRGLTPEELEILRQPKVQRLVNVNKLCKIPTLPGRVNTFLTMRRFPRLLL